MKKNLKRFTALSAAVFAALYMNSAVYAAQKYERKSLYDIYKNEGQEVDLKDIDAETLRKKGADFQDVFIPLDKLDESKYEIVTQSPDFLKEDEYVKAIHFYYDVYKKNDDGQRGERLYAVRLDYIVDDPALHWWENDYGCDFWLDELKEGHTYYFQGEKVSTANTEEMKAYLKMLYAAETDDPFVDDIVECSYNERTVIGQPGYLYTQDGYYMNGNERLVELYAYTFFGSPMLPNEYCLRINSHLDIKVDGSSTYSEADLEKMKQQALQMIDGGGHWADPVVLYADIPVEESTVTTTEKTTTTTTTEKSTEETTLLHKVKDSDAKEEKGEDDGISIPEIIVVGAGGAAAAAMAGGASGGDGDGGKKRRSRYKMYLYKDFGDTIKCGGYNTAKEVYARMAEITYDGKETDRPDLTQGINIFAGSDNISVADVSMAGNYKAAHVWTEAGTPEGEGIVCFKYTGEGGTFTNRVHFNLVGESAIEFPHLGAYTAVNVLFGDKEPTRVEFRPVGFEYPVQKIWLESNSPDFTPEYELDEQGRLFAVVKNKTEKDVPVIGDHPKRAQITVHAENEKEKAENSFGLDIYPEGISLCAKTEDGRIKVPTNIGSSVNIYRPELQATAFKLAAAYKEADGSVKVDEDNFKFTELQPYDDVAKNIIDSKDFNYKIDQRYKQIIPLATLLEKPEDRFYFSLNVKYAENGQNFEFDIPLRLTGEKLDPDKLAREEEKKKLKRILEIVGLAPGGNAQAKIRNWDKIPTEKLYIVRWAVFVEGRDYYLNEASEFEQIAKELDDAVNALETTKYFGDLAFSTLIRIKLGDMWEAVLTPLKNLIVDYTAKYVSARFIWETDTPDFLDPAAWMTCFLSMAENSIVAWVTDGITNFQGPSQKSMRTICLCVGGCIGLSYYRHYYYDEDPDIKYSEWGSLKASMKDLSLNLLKAFLIYMFVGGMKRNKVFSSALMKFSAVVAKDGATLTTSMLKAGVQTNVRLAEAVMYGTSDILYTLPGAFTSSMKNLFGHVGDMMSQAEKVRLEIDGKEFFMPGDVYLYVVVMKLIELFHIEEIIESLRSALGGKELPKQPKYIPPAEVEKDMAALKSGE